MNTNRCASLAKLCELKDVTESDARAIRAVWLARGIDAAYSAAPEGIARAVERTHARDYHAPKVREVKRALIDRIIGTHGVEYLGENRRSGESVYYCNAGDSYAGTIIFHGRTLSVGCWGDLVERGTIK